MLRPDETSLPVYNVVEHVAKRTTWDIMLRQQTAQKWTVKRTLFHFANGQVNYKSD